MSQSQVNTELLSPSPFRQPKAEHYFMLVVGLLASTLLISGCSKLIDASANFRAFNVVELASGTMCLFALNCFDTPR